jgi:hypothetical protein
LSENYFDADLQIFRNKSNSEAMRITSTGLVGIGLTSPSSVLDIASNNSGMTITNTGASNKKWRVGGGSGGTFQITEAGIADRFTIDTSGNVGIGTSSPATKLDIQQSTTDLLGISLLNTNNSAGTVTSSQLRMGITNSAGVSYAVIKAQETNVDDWPAITFSAQNAVTTTPTERMRVNWDGNVLIGITSSNANGGCLQLKSGITFPATQSASSDANTLDDYEEGTWTPTAVGQTSAGTTTYVARAGNYTKIGNIATATCYIVVSGMTGTGNLLISLPFVANENYNSMGAVATYNLDWPQAGSLVVWAVAGFAYVRIHVSADNSADAIVQTDASWEATFTITYQV